MRKALSFVSIVVALNSFGQIAPELPEYKGNIDYVIQKKFGKVGANIVRPDGTQLNMGGSYKYTGLKTTMHFNPNGTLKSKRVELRKLPFMVESYSFDTLDSKVIQTTHFGEKSAFNSGTTQIKEISLSSEGHPMSLEYSFEPASEDTSLILPFDHSARYMDGKLASFKHTDLNFYGDTIHKSIVEITRNSEGMITSMIERTDGIYTYRIINYEERKKELKTERSVESQVIKKWTFKYNSENRVTSQTIELLADFHTPEEKAATTTFSYLYDKYGNWKVRYKQVGNGSKQIETKQKIKYRK